MRKILLSTIALSFCAGSAFADNIDIYDTVSGQTISSGTTALIHSGATLSDSTVDGGYVEFAETDASATGLTITNSGSLKSAKANANFSDSYIDNGGKATLSSSFTAEDITVGNGGLFQASGTTGVVENLIIQQGGAYSLSTNLASVNATIQDNDDPDKKHYATISGKVAENFYIGENSKLQVTTDSTANNTIVNGGTLEGSSSKSN
ncbi:MAG: hypothetical protein IKA30_01480, partial [Alphaproteobacteria bacterium]|nr:hypothetical protein [Alphaproteobacteria bacterium]